MLRAHAACSSTSSCDCSIASPGTASPCAGSGPEVGHRPDVCCEGFLQEALTAEQKRAAAASYAGRRMGPRGGGGRGDHQWRRLRRVRLLTASVLLPCWNEMCRPALSAFAARGPRSCTDLTLG